MCVKVPPMCIKSLLQEVPAPGKVPESEDSAYWVELSRQHVKMVPAGKEKEREKKMAPISWRQAEGEEEAGTHQSPPMRAGLQKCVKSDASPSSQCSKTSKGLGSPRPAISALGQMSPSQTPLRGFLDHYFCEGLLGGSYCLLVKARCFGALLSGVSMKNWGCSMWDLNPSLLREKLQVVSSH